MGLPPPFRAVSIQKVVAGEMASAQLSFGFEGVRTLCPSTALAREKWRISRGISGRRQGVRPRV